MTDGAFCARLRRERERRQIALSSISANTKIRVGVFEALERGDVSRWPAGIYRRAIIRAYALGVGLDPDEITREFLEHFPHPDDASAAAMEAPAIPAHAQAARPPVLRLTLADEASLFAAGSLLPRLRDRLAAVAIDACVVLAIATSVFVVCGAFWAPVAVAMPAYYFGGILLLGNTPGVCFRAPGRRAPTRSSLITLRSRMARAAVPWLTRFKRDAWATGWLKAIR